MPLAGTDPPGTMYRSGGFTVDVLRHSLGAEGRDIPLAPKEFQTLLLLVEAAEELAINELSEPFHHWTRTYRIPATLCPREMQGEGSDDQPSKRAVIYPRNGVEQLSHRPNTPLGQDR